MNQIEQATIVLELMNALRAQGSWCGETHIQKCVYLVQEALKVPSDFEFVLYKYGPYSFDLRDLLGEMRADLLIDREARPYPYGPSLKPSTSGSNLLRRREPMVAQYRPAIEQVAEYFGSKNVTALEEIGTALYVTAEGETDPHRRAERLTRLKPHVSQDAALRAIQEVDKLLDAKSTSAMMI